jgi:hypothetical protein
MSYIALVIKRDQTKEDETVRKCRKQGVKKYEKYPQKISDVNIIIQA